MATKAELFRAETERLAQHRKKASKKPKPAAPRFSHNDAHRVDKRSSYAIEPQGARASRKSTRGSSNRIKTDSALRITASNANASPKARAARKNGD